MDLQSIASKYGKLPSEEERNLLVKTKKGATEEEKQEAKVKLLYHHSALILSIVNKFNSIIGDNYYLRQDAESAGIEGFLRALNKFDLKYDNRVGTYAYYRIYLEVWDSLLNNTIAHFIPKHVYKEIYRFVSAHRDSQDENTMLEYIGKKLKIDESTALIILNIVKDGGLQNLSQLEGFGDEDSDLSSKNSEGLKSAIEIEEAISAPTQVELSLIATDLEDYAKSNLTIPQQRVINTVVLPYLRERKIVTFAEAADLLMVSYQNVTQSFQYIQMKMVNSSKGRKLAWVIKTVIEQTKGHRRSRGRKQLR